MERNRVRRAERDETELRDFINKFENPFNPSFADTKAGAQAQEMMGFRLTGTTFFDALAAHLIYVKCQNHLTADLDDVDEAVRQKVKEIAFDFLKKIAGVVVTRTEGTINEFTTAWTSKIGEKHICVVSSPQVDEETQFYEAVTKMYACFEAYMATRTTWKTVSIIT